MKRLPRWLAVIAFSTSMLAGARPLFNLGPFSQVIPQASGWGYEPGEVKVTPQGLSVTLNPKPASTTDAIQ